MPSRRRLLVGTALGSSFLIFSVVPALAANCTLLLSPMPIAMVATTPVTCANTEPRTATAAGTNAIGITTTGDGNSIDITNSGTLTTDPSSFVPGPVLLDPHKQSTGAKGIYAHTNGIGADITIDNSGTINAYDNAIVGIDDVNGSDTHITITNSGALTTGQDSEGIVGQATYGSDNVVTITNTGHIVTGTSTLGSGQSSGIVADVGGDDGLAQVTNSGAITTTGTSAAGISAFAAQYNGSDSDVVVYNNIGGDISATGDEAYGIFAQAGTATNPSPDDGGTVLVTNDATIHAGGTAIGGFTYGENGTLTIDNTGRLTADSYQGIYANTYGENGDVYITNAGAVDSGEDSILSHTYASESDITIQNSGALTTHDAAAGNMQGGAIEAIADQEFSSISITNSGALDTSNNVDAAVPITLPPSPPIKNESDGILAITGHGLTFDQEGGDITISNTGSIHAGPNGEGIFALSTGSDSTVAITNGGAIQGGTSVQETGAGTAIFGDVDGNDTQITINNSGALTTSGYNAAGISATANYYSGSNGDITIYNNIGGDIETSGMGADGIFATAGSKNNVGAVDDEGQIVITNAATINGSGSKSTGIGAYSYGSHGDITITNSGSITADYGIVGETNSADAVLTITNNGHVFGEEAGIQIYAAGAGIVTIGANGYVGSDNYAAILSETGGITINDNGMVVGYVGLTHDNTMNIGATGTFRTIGDSDFGTGNNVLDNAGTIDSSGENVAFNGLGQLTSSGRITMVDGDPGDSLTTSGDFTGNNGTLEVDADLGANTGVADVLYVDGTTDGHTGVVVNVTGFGNGAANYAGVPVVITGTTHDSDFSLVNGPVNAGFFAYDLFRDGDEHVLRAVGIGNAAYELPAGVSGAQNLWGQGGDVVHDHIVETMGGGKGGTSDGPTVSGWFQGFGGWSKLDPTIGFDDPDSGRAESLDLDDSQTSDGIVGGVDFGVGSVAGGALRFGLMAGYVTSTLDFDATADSWDYKGGSLGAYASFMKDGFFLNGLLKADRLNVGVTDVQGSVTEQGSTNATTIGGRVGAGYHFDAGWGYIEPELSLSGARTTIDDMELFDGDVAFADGSSGQAKASVRVGTDVQLGDTTVSPSVTVSVWNQFGAANSAGISGLPSTPTLTATSPATGTAFGGLALGMTFVKADGWSGGLRGTYQVSSDSQGGSISASISHSW